MSKKLVLIVGGTGAIGSRLVNKHDDGFELRILTRQRSKLNNYTFHWDPLNKMIDKKSLHDVYAIINLSGTNIISKPWTDNRKEEIINSRVETTRFLCQSIADVQPAKLKLLINASAIGIYGPTDDLIFDEHTQIPSAGDFLWKVCTLWEKALFDNCPSYVHPIALRLGMVLDSRHGLIPKLLPGTSLGFGAFPGHGRQIISWVHVEDVIRIVDFLINSQQPNKLPHHINCTAPEAVSIRQMVNSIIKAKSTKPRLHIGIPEWVLKITLGERTTALTSSQHITSNALAKMGFSFKYPHIADALKDLIKSN